MSPLANHAAVFVAAAVIVAIVVPLLMFAVVSVADWMRRR